MKCGCNKLHASPHARDEWSEVRPHSPGTRKHLCECDCNLRAASHYFTSYDVGFSISLSILTPFRTLGISPEGSIGEIRLDVLTLGVHQGIRDSLYGSGYL
jgi:hypothetical protein